MGPDYHYLKKRLEDPNIGDQIIHELVALGLPNQEITERRKINHLYLKSCVNPLREIKEDCPFLCSYNYLNIQSHLGKFTIESGVNIRRFPFSSDDYLLQRILTVVS